MGLPVLATVFLEITSPVILLMIAAFLIHEVTAYADLRIAVREREVTPPEQMVHSFIKLYGDDAPHRYLAGQDAPRGGVEGSTGRLSQVA